MGRSGHGAQEADRDDREALLDPPTPVLEGDDDDADNDSGDDDEGSVAAGLVGADVDAVLAHIGEFGRSQQLTYAQVAYVWVVVPMMMLNMVFVSPTVVPWRCVANATASECANSTAVSSDTDRMCRVPTDQREFAHPTHTVTAEFGMVCGNGWQPAFLGSLFFLGFGVGAAVFGPLGDTIGRRRTYGVTLVGTAVAVLASAACRSFASYAVARVLCGFFSSGLGLSAFTLSSEVLGKGYRTSAGILVQCFFALGEMCLAGLASAVRDWREQTLLVLVFTAPLIVGLFTLMPESPRWLLAHGHTARALRQLGEMARQNGSVLPAGVTLRQPDRTAETVSILTVLRHRMLRPRLLIMAFCWFACSFLYYGLMLAASSITDDPYSDFAWQAAAEIPGIVAAMYAIDWRRTGRRGSLKAGFWVTAAAAAALAVFVHAAPASRTTLAMLGKFGISGNFAIVYVVPTELFPTTARVSALGLCSVAARVGGVIAPQTVLFSRFGDAVPFVVFAAPAAAAALLTSGLPETRGKNLPQSLSDVVPGGGHAGERFAVDDVVAGAVPLHDLATADDYGDASAVGVRGGKEAGARWGSSSA